MNETGIADRSFKELVSAGSAECTISELACRSGEVRVIIKSDAFTDDLVEKDSSTGQDDKSKESSFTLRTSLTKFHSFGRCSWTNVC